MISAQASKISYVIVAGVADYFFPYPFFSKTDLQVFSGAAGVQNQLVLDYDYSIQPIQDNYPSGATVRLLTNQTAGNTLVINRVMPLTQSLSLPETGELDTKALEKLLDKIIMIHQQYDEMLSRAILMSETGNPDVAPDDLLVQMYAIQSNVTAIQTAVNTLLASNVFGVIAGVVLTEDVGANKLVNIYYSSGLKGRKADNTLGYVACGMLLTAKTSGQTVTVYRAGVCAGQTGLTAGADCYLDTVGGITQADSSTTGAIEQNVGSAISSTAYFVNLQPAIQI